MTDRRIELIIRLPNLSPATATRATNAFRASVAKLGGSLSRIEREHYSDHAIHINRERII